MKRLFSMTRIRTATAKPAPTTPPIWTPVFPAADPAISTPTVAARPAFPASALSAETGASQPAPSAEIIRIVVRFTARNRACARLETAVSTAGRRACMMRIAVVLDV